MDEMDNKPIVSIVMPCYNCEKTVSETIECVLKQTYTNWELLCVDDGSLDDTVGVINAYCKLDSRVKLIIRNSSLKGGSVCRNLGINAASGSYVMFLDSDDLLSKDCIERRIIIALENGCAFSVFPYGTFSQSIDDAKPHSICRKNPEYRFATSMSGWIITSSFIKRDFLLGIGSFDEKYPRLQDVEMHLRLLTTPGITYRIYETLTPDCFYRSFESGYSLEKLHRSITAYEKFIKLIDSLINERRLPNKKLFALSQIVLYGNLSMIRYKLWRGGIKDKYSEVFCNYNLKKKIGILNYWVISFLNIDYSYRILDWIKFRVSWLFFILAQNKLQKWT